MSKKSSKKWKICHSGIRGTCACELCGHVPHMRSPYLTKIIRIRIRILSINLLQKIVLTHIKDMNFFP